jgi:hypothetical protein
MGPGHLGVGFAVKTIAPRAPLWRLLVASELLDLMSFVFLTLGSERLATMRFDFTQSIKIIERVVVAWSHGLPLTIIWTCLATAIAYLLLRDRGASAIVGAVVLSPWVLDFIVHPPDLPLLFAGSREVGLGLWTSVPGLILSLVLEIGLLAAGVSLYLRWRRKGTLE